MPARPRIAALIAGLALAAPPAALAETGREQTLPRTGFDVLPVAAIGLALLLGGLALRRRPHAGP